MKIRTLIFAALVFIIAACGEQPEKTELTVSPDLIGTAGAGSMAEFKKQYEGKVLLVNFFASWCPPCRVETPDFVRVFTEEQDRFALVALSTDPNRAELAKYMSEFNVNYPVYIADQALSREYGISTIPTSIIFAPDGKLLDVIVGPVSEQAIKNYISKFQN